jgi:hypothetical protein
MKPLLEGKLATHTVVVGTDSQDVAKATQALAKFTRVKANTEDTYNEYDEYRIFANLNRPGLFVKQEGL